MVPFSRSAEPQLQRMAATMAGAEARAADLSHPIARFLFWKIGQTQQSLRSGQYGVQSRHANSGLAGSMHAIVEPTRGAITTGTAHGRMLQLGMPGGVLAPREKQYLTLPIGENVKGNGDAVISHARDVPGGFPWRNPKTGKLFIASRDERTPRRSKGRRVHKGMMAALADQYEGQSLGLRLWFLLVRSVRAVPHFWCRWESPADDDRWRRHGTDWILRGR